MSIPESPDDAAANSRRREMKADPHRLLPQSIEAERAFLGSAMQNARDVISGGRERGVNDGHFAIPAHAIIWRRLCAMEDARAKIDYVTLCQALTDAGELMHAGGAPNVTDILVSAPPWVNWESYAGTMEEKRFLRETIRGATEIGALCYDSQDDIPGVRTFAESLLAKVADPDTTRKKRQSTSQVVASVLQKIEAKDTAAIWGIPTGFVNLDYIAKGLRAGNMIVIGGQTSAGKTSFALNLVWNVCVKQGEPAVVFSFEMTAEEVTESLLQIGASVNIDALLAGHATGREQELFGNASNALGRAPLTIRDETDLDILQVRSIARRLRPRVIVLDYAQLIRGGGRKYERRDLEIADVSRNAKNMAGELGATVILITQLNDDGKVSESRAIAKDANQVWTVEDGAEETIKILTVAKQRRGKKDAANFKWIGACQKFVPGSV